MIETETTEKNNLQADTGNNLTTNASDDPPREVLKDSAREHSERITKKTGRNTKKTTLPPNEQHGTSSEDDESETVPAKRTYRLDVYRNGGARITREPGQPGVPVDLDDIPKVKEYVAKDFPSLKHSPKKGTHREAVRAPALATEANTEISKAEKRIGQEGFQIPIDVKPHSNLIRAREGIQLQLTLDFSAITYPRPFDCNVVIYGKRFGSNDHEKLGERKISVKETRAYPLTLSLGALKPGTYRMEFVATCVSAEGMPMPILGHAQGGQISVS